MTNLLPVVDMIDADIIKCKAKIKKFKDVIKKRKEASQKNYPGKVVLELETVGDWVDIASLEGEIKALRRIRKQL